MRRTAVLVAALMVMASCTGSDSADEAELTTTTEAAEATSTTTGTGNNAAPADELVITVLGTSDSRDRSVPDSFNPSIVVPPDGLPFMVYLDLATDPEGRTAAAVKCTDPACSGDVVSTSFDTIGSLGSDVAIGPDGLPAFTLNELAFGGNSPPTVRVVRCLEPTCVDHTVVEIGGGFATSLMVPGDDLPLLTMSQLGVDQPVAVKCSDPSCNEYTATELPSDTKFRPVMVRPGPDDLPVLAFTANRVLSGQGIVGTVNVIFCSDPTCSDTQSIARAQADPNTELVGFEIAPDGPVFSFAAKEAPLRGLRLMRCLDHWCEQTGPVSLIGPNQLIWGAAMAVSSDGLPVFIYTSRGGIQVARCADPDCTEGTVATIDEKPAQLPPGQVRAIALDDADRPIAVYARFPYSPPVDLLAASCVDPGCVLGAIEVGSWDQESSVIELEPGEEVMPGWTAVADETVFGSNGSLDRLLPGGPGLLAFGAVCEFESADPGSMECTSTVWGSADGIDWEQAATFHPDHRFTTVTAGGPGFVAASTTCVLEPVSCGPAIWTSAGGTDWDRAPVDDGVFALCPPTFSPSCQPTIDHLVTLPTGDLLAVATSIGGTSMAWVSADGLDWRVSDTNFDPFGSDSPEWEIFDLVAAGPGVIAVGSEFTEKVIPLTGVRLVDADGTGVEIDRISSGGPAEQAGLRIGDLVVALDGASVTDQATFSKLRSAHEPGDTVILTVVRDGESSGIDLTFGSYEEFYYPALVATSTDGVNWAAVNDVFDVEGDSDFSSSPIGWAGGIAAAANVCDGFELCENIVVTSADGAIWQRLPDNGTFDEGLFRVFPFVDGGLLVFQSTRDQLSGQVQVSFVASPDGTGWTRFAADPEAFPGEVFISDLVQYNDRLVAVGVSVSPGMGSAQVWVYETPG